MNKSHLLINEQALQVLPSLAIALGLEEAIAIQQLHYWLNNPKNEGRVDEDGNKWVYNTYAEWKEDNFPFWSEDKIQRVFLNLKNQGVVIIRQLDAKRRDMRNFYRIDYEKLNEFDISITQNHGMDGLKSAPSNASNPHDVKMNQRLPENTSLSSSQIQEIEAEANKTVDAILGMAKGQEGYWQGRELIRADLLPLADWYNKTTNQVMTKRAQKSWWKALGEWKEEGLKPEHLQVAFESQSKWRMVSDPNMLTKDAVAVKASGGFQVEVQGKPRMQTIGVT